MAKDFFTFYIDESCHLEHDRSPIMCIGAIKVPNNKIKKYKDEIKAIKIKYGIPYEIKWNTIGLTYLDMYKELVDYFFNSEMEFRCVLITYKDRLDNESFNGGEHDNFYYKMIYYLLYNPYAYDYSSNVEYRVLLDIKDSRGREKLDKIKQVFSNKFYGSSPFSYFQHIRSHESQFIQLTDLFIGAIGYKARGLNKILDSGIAKNEIITYIENKSGYTLDEGTEPSEKKFNIFNHQPQKKNEK